MGSSAISDGISPTVFASPAVVRLDRDPSLAADLLDRRPVLRLLRCEGNLLLTEPSLLHATNLLAGPGQT